MSQKRCDMSIMLFRLEKMARRGKCCQRLDPRFHAIYSREREKRNEPCFDGGCLDRNVGKECNFHISPLVFLFGFTEQQQYIAAVKNRE